MSCGKSESISCLLWGILWERVKLARLLPHVQSTNFYEKKITPSCPELMVCVFRRWIQGPSIGAFKIKTFAPISLFFAETLENLYFFVQNRDQFSTLNLSKYSRSKRWSRMMSRSEWGSENLRLRLRKVNRNHHISNWKDISGAKFGQNTSHATLQNPCPRFDSNIVLTNLLFSFWPIYSTTFTNTFCKRDLTLIT